MTLRFVHFSDIHFGQERGDGSWQPFPDVRREAITDLRRVLAEELVKGPADAILVSGDIAQAGLEDEYKTASEWLDEALKAAGCPALSMRCVPGNHDVNLKRMTDVGLQTHNLLRNSSVDDAYAYLASLSGQVSNSIADKFVDYRAFAHAYGSDFVSDTNPVNVAKFDMENGCGLRLIGFSTVAISDRKDVQGKLLLGANQYQISRDTGFEDIVMMHHPLHWLADRDRAEAYLNSRARVVLTGHEHYANLNKIEHDHGFDQLRVASGALTPPGAGEGYWFSYNWIEFDWLEPVAGRPQLQVTIFPRAWNPKQTRFGPDAGRLPVSEVCKRVVLSCEPQIGVAPSGAGAKVKATTTTAEVPSDLLSLPETDIVPEEIEDRDSFATLRYLFWRYLSRDERVDALIKVGLLAERARQSVPTYLEQEAFTDAGEDVTILAALWDITMPKVPAEQQKSNPFGGKS